MNSPVRSRDSALYGTLRRLSGAGMQPSASSSRAVRKEKRRLKPPVIPPHRLNRADSAPLAPTTPRPGPARAAAPPRARSRARRAFAADGGDEALVDRGHRGAVERGAMPPSAYPRQGRRSAGSSPSRTAPPARPPRHRSAGAGRSGGRWQSAWRRPCPSAPLASRRCIVELSLASSTYSPIRPPGALSKVVSRQDDLGRRPSPR